MSGELKHECYIYATVPDIIELFDIDGDGHLEILGAGKSYSNRGTFYVHDIDGNPKQNINVGPWLCIFKSHIIREYDGKLCIACGMNYGVNFKKFTVDKGNYTLDFSKKLGGTVSAIHMDIDNASFYVGSSKGTVMAFDKDGKDLWYADVKNPVQDIFPFKDSIIVLSRNGDLRKLSKTNGQACGFKALDSNTYGCLSNDNRIIIACGKYLYMM